MEFLLLIAHLGYSHDERGMRNLLSASHQHLNEQNPWKPLGPLHLFDHYRNEQYIDSEQEKSWTSETIY
jgi:hypothetical protein